MTFINSVSRGLYHTNYSPPKIVYTEQMKALSEAVPGFAPLTYRRTLETTDTFSEAVSVLEIKKKATRNL